VSDQSLFKPMEVGSKWTVSALVGRQGLLLLLSSRGRLLAVAELMVKVVKHNATENNNDRNNEDECFIVVDDEQT